MTVNDRRENLSHDHPAFLLRQPDIPAKVVEQLSLHAELEHEEDVSLTLEIFDQLDDVRVATDKPE